MRRHGSFVFVKARIKFAPDFAENAATRSKRELPAVTSREEKEPRRAGSTFLEFTALIDILAKFTARLEFRMPENALEAGECGLRMQR